jgi:hypothetical protein
MDGVGTTAFCKHNFECVVFSHVHEELEPVDLQAQFRVHIWSVGGMESIRLPHPQLKIWDLREVELLEVE